MGRALADALPHHDELAERLALALDGRALFTGRRGLQAALTLDVPAPPPTVAVPPTPLQSSVVRTPPQAQPAVRADGELARVTPSGRCGCRARPRTRTATRRVP